MDKQYIYIVVIIVAYMLIKFFLGGRKPKSKTFICARCKTAEKYSHRTIEAWRRGFNKIYCQECHKRWLANNPSHVYKKANYSKGGCLSILAIGLFVPLATFTLSKYVS